MGIRLALDKRLFAFAWFDAVLIHSEQNTSTSNSKVWYPWTLSILKFKSTYSIFEIDNTFNLMDDHMYRYMRMSFHCQCQRRTQMMKYSNPWTCHLLRGHETETEVENDANIGNKKWRTFIFMNVSIPGNVTSSQAGESPHLSLGNKHVLSSNSFKLSLIPPIVRWPV